MRNHLFEMRYYDTYFYSNVVANILSRQSEFLRTMHDIFENDGWKRFAEPFPKYTALHMFAEDCIRGILSEEFESDKDPKLLLRSINRLFSAHHLKPPKFSDYYSHSGEPSVDDIYDFYIEIMMTQEYEELIGKMTDEIFYVMFQNRNAMQSLNGWIAGYISLEREEQKDEDVSKMFTKSGKLKRVYIPSWARKAVFYRDRGSCSNCGRDLSGIIRIDSSDNFDHIIPLNQFGINCITNLQLMCEQCNLKKSGNFSKTSPMYERWYPK